MNIIKVIFITIVILLVTGCGSSGSSSDSADDPITTPTPIPTPMPHGSDFDSTRDLISLHYDHAADRDDGHSAAADRTVLQKLFPDEWVQNQSIRVSGTCGINCPTFRHSSSQLMNKVWTEALGGWILGVNQDVTAVSIVAQRWYLTILDGGWIWVKEGGQSDFTAKVIKSLHENFGVSNTKTKIIVVQHSEWNEDHTKPNALNFVKEHATYIKISDANAYLRKNGGDDKFENAARNHPVVKNAWRAAFEYLNPNEKLDFSDTGELLKILDFGRLSIDEFRKTFLE